MVIAILQLKIATSGTINNITGKLQNDGVPVLQITSTRDFTTTGDITGALTTCSDLVTDSYASLNTTLTDHSVAIATHKNDISTLETKTQNITSAVAGVDTTFRGSLLVGSSIANDACRLSGAGSTFYSRVNHTGLTHLYGNTDCHGTNLIDVGTAGMQTLNVTGINGLTPTGGKCSKISTTDLSGLQFSKDMMGPLMWIMLAILISR